MESGCQFFKNKWTKEFSILSNYNIKKAVLYIVQYTHAGHEKHELKVNHKILTFGTLQQKMNTEFKMNTA